MNKPGPAGESFAAVSETHSAAVFFAGGLAFKLKKPVNLGFLDFTSPEARRAACDAEVELNRRFAPDVYLGVAELRDPGGHVVDNLVMMRRMPASRRLATLIAAGEPAGQALLEVARQVAAAHAASPRRADIAEQGDRAALLRRWDANLQQARSLTNSPLSPAVVDEVGRLARRFVAGRAALFAARMHTGRIVDGHGDLLADDIFCLDDGPRVLDCLEFDDRLRWLDGLDDAACLAMDLEYLGSPALAERFMSWYSEFTADPAPPALIHHYVAYRAFMRAKVSALRCGQGDLRAAGQARALAALALQHLRAGTITMVLVGGLPGTGKSTLAAQLAARFGWTVLSSDRIRKELAGMPATQPCPAAYGTGLYAPEWTARTYAELMRRAALLLGRGESVIADASWVSPDQRLASARVAKRAGADLVQLRCAAPEGLAEHRMRTREADPSDADPEIGKQMAAAEEPWPEGITIDTADSDDALARAISAARPPPPEVAWRPTRPYMQPD